MTVKSVGLYTLEVLDAGKSNTNQPFQEKPHVITAKGDHGADLLALADLEVCNGFSGLGLQDMLTGDLLELFYSSIEKLLIGNSLADTNTDNNLFQGWNLHLGGVAKFLEQGRCHSFEVFRFKVWYELFH